MRKRIVILASGGGSNAGAIIKHFNGLEVADVVAVISNRSTAGVHHIAASNNVPSFSYSKAEIKAGELDDKVLSLEPDMVVLAGYLLKISESLTSKLSGKIVNIHPALLPKYGGKGMYGMHVHEAVFASGESESGITIHYVNENFDEGKIIRQVRCNIAAATSAEEVKNMVLSLEHQYFSETIEGLLKT